MPVEGIKSLVIDGVFSKGYIQPTGEYTMLSTFTPYCRNIRINNQNTSVRPGFITRAKDLTILNEYIRGINSNNSNMYVALNSKLKKVDTTAGTYTDIGTLNSDVNVNFVNYGKYQIICDGAGYPYVYDGSLFKQMTISNIEGGFIATATIGAGGTGYSVNDILTVTQFGASGGTIRVTTVNAGVVTGIEIQNPGKVYTVASGLATTVAPTGGTNCTINITAITSASPIFGDSFLNGVYLVGSGLKKNTLYLSSGITNANPEYAIDFVGTGAEQLYMKSDIVGICGTLNRLFIRTKADGIRYISRETTVSAGGLSATDTLPISGSTGNIPASQRAIVKADDLVFFMTATKQIKSLNYVQGITEAQVGNISERASQSIRDFMDSLDDDQSKCFGYFNGNSRTVHWHVKEKGMPFNNKVLVYDIINDTFLIDDNKFMSCCVYHEGKYYTGSAINTVVFEDEVGYDDDGMPINWSRYTKNMNFGNQNIRKMFRGVGIVGQLSPMAQIKVEVLVDGQSEHTSYINGPGLPSAGLGSSPLGSDPVGLEYREQTLQNFQKYLSKGDIRAKGYVMQVRFSGSCKGDQVVLSSMSTDIYTTNTVELSDKI